MTLPTKVKTWQYNVNQDLNTLGVALTDRQRLLRTIKNSLIGFGAAPWTVQGSSNSVAAAMDGVDRWAADANLVWANAGVAHSWIVLRQTGIGATFEMCIDLSSISPRVLSCILAVGGSFAGGTTLNRPTAGTELDVSPTRWFKGDDALTFSCALHVQQSNDGAITRVGVFDGGIL